MKSKLLAIFLLLATLTSCGGKGGKTTEANIVILGGIASGIPGMTGGTKIYGYNFQTRETLNLTYNGQASIQLSNGPWGFSAVTWDGDANNDGTPEGSVLEGKVFCGSTDMFLSGGDVAVNLTLSHAGCSDDFFGDLETKENDGQFKVFEPYKCIDRKNVDELSEACNPSIAMSYKVELPDSYGNPGLLSGCFTESDFTTPEMAATASNLRIPIIGFFDNSFTTKIYLYDQVSCGGNPQVHTIGNPYHDPKANFDDDNISQGDVNPNRLRIHVDPCLFDNGKITATPFSYTDSVPTTYRVLCTPDQFENIDGVDLAGNYVLHRNLDFTGYTFTDSLIAGVFLGELHGNGHTISNVTISTNALSDIGLFSIIDGAGSGSTTVQDLKLSNITINVHEGSNIGGLAGKIQPGTHIERIQATDITVNATSSTGSYSGIGGLIGTTVAGGGTNSSFHAIKVDTVNIDTQSGYSQVGGLIGSLNNENNLRFSKLENVNVDTTATAAEFGYGGVIGYMAGANAEVAGVTATNVNIGSVSAPGGVITATGGFVGKIDSGRLILNKVTGSLTSNSTSTSGGTGGFVGNVSSGAGSTFIHSNIADMDINSDATETGGFAGSITIYAGANSIDLTGNRSLGVLNACEDICGGFAGLVTNTSTGNLSLLQNYSLSNVTSNTSAAVGFVGGFAGQINKTGGVLTINEAFSKGIVTASSTDYVGGFSGNNNAADLSNIYSTSNVIAIGTFTGSLIGSSNSGSVDKSYASGTSTGSKCINGTGSTVLNTYCLSGNDTSANYSGSLTTKNSTDISNLSSTTDFGGSVAWSSGTDSELDFYKSLSAIGETYTGTFFDPIILTSPVQWNAIGDNEHLMGKSFKLGASLNFGGGSACSNFNPIGSNTFPFHGNLSGNNYTISNINCTETAQGQPLGLFRKVGTKVDEGAGSISDIDLFDYSIQKSLYIDNVHFTSDDDLGLIAGITIDDGPGAGANDGPNEHRNANKFNRIVVTNSSVTQTGAGKMTGGFIGDMIISNQNTSFTRSSFQGALNIGAGDVSSSSGGLFGRVQGTTTVSAPARNVDFAVLNFTGTISTNSATQNVGGFAGEISQDKIEIAYSSADVSGGISGANYIGGFVSSFVKGMIRNSYVKASVSASGTGAVAGGFASFMTASNGAKLFGSYVESPSVASSGGTDQAGCLIGFASISPIAYNNIANCASVTGATASYLSAGGVNLNAKEKNVYVSLSDEARGEGTWVTPTQFSDPNHMDSVATELVYGDPWFTSVDGTPRLWWEVFPDALNF